MPTSDGHQPLPGDTDFALWSEQDITNMVAALRGDESSPEVRAQLEEYVLLRHPKHVLELTAFDRLFNNSEEESLRDAYEYALAGPADAQVDG
jgi:hypothetical protein